MAYDTRLPSYEDLRALSMVYLRAIALAWTQDDVGKKFRDLLEKDTAKALEEFFNYRCPFSINLELLYSKQSAISQWVPTTTNAGGERVPGHWVGLPKNEIIFNLPNKPKPMFDEAIALGAYVEGGKGYLFTCC